MSAKGHIYLIREREFIKTNENVYKIGKSTNVTVRLMKYPKGSEIILIMECMNIHKCERDIINKFNNEYEPRKDIGNEYYEGSKSTMIEHIYELVISCNDKSSEDEPLEDKSVEVEQDFITESIKSGFNYNTDTLPLVLNEPMEINDIFGDTIPSIFADHFPDLKSIPVIEKVHKVAKDLVKKIQYVICRFYQITNDYTYAVTAHEFVNLLHNIENYKRYELEPEIIDMVVQKMSNYKIKSLCCNSIKSHYPSRVVHMSIHGLKLKNVIPLSIIINRGNLNTLLSEFKLKYGHKLCTTGLCKGSIYDSKKYNFDFERVKKIANYIAKELSFVRANYSCYDSFSLRHMIEEWFINKRIVPSEQTYSYVSTGECILACYMLGCNMDATIYNAPSIAILIEVNLNKKDDLNARQRKIA